MHYKVLTYQYNIHIHYFVLYILLVRNLSGINTLTYEIRGYKKMPILNKKELLKKQNIDNSQYLK